MNRDVIRFPRVEVADAEFRRLLGYPRGAVPSARAEELAAWARAWFAEHGRPWIYSRTANLRATASQLFLDGVAFNSPQLQAHFAEAEASEAVLFAASAGAACETRARELWQEGKPDEYFFLETYGSAVVERLVALINAQVCADADADGKRAIPHYSPGYGTWDVAEQNALFAIVSRSRPELLPGPLEVLSSGMLRPKKSLLGVIGLTGNRTGAAPSAAVPCERCSFSPCSYRRVPYRFADARMRRDGEPEDQPGLVPDAPFNAPTVSEPLTRNATYSINRRALEKWTRERLQLHRHPDGAISAVFRFDGTTCSNMGRSLAFEYRIELGNVGTRYRIERLECAPVAGDDGYQAMCEYLRDPEGLMTAIATEKPLVGAPLDDVLTWRREHVSTGCYCDAASRAHKWGLALEAVHFGLAHGSALSAGKPTVAFPAPSRVE